MHEILFKGYNELLDKWIYGDLIEDNEKFFIAVKNSLDEDLSEKIYTKCIFDKNYTIFEVKKESIGQFIGKYDEKGNKIFENDKIIFKPKNANIELGGFIKYNKDICSFVVISNGNMYNLGYIDIITVEQ